MFLPWEVLELQAREAASQVALRNCSKEVGKESGFKEVYNKEGR